MPALALGVQFALAGLAAHVDTRPATIGLAILFAAISLGAWVWSYRRQRAFGDTPTSRIASAAQGVVELRGRGVALDGLPVLSRLTGLPCLWTRFRIEERDAEGKWQVIDSGQSDASFLIDDGSGQCLVDVEDAEVITGPPEVHTIGGTERRTEWNLLIGCHICALGEFRTVGGSDPELDLRQDVSTVLADWKEDRAELLRRFDLDRNGEIDLHEWELARQAARREVEQQHRDIRASADLHTLRRPPDGRPFIVSNLDLHHIARRYRLWSIVHVTVFFAALIGLGWAMKRG